MKKFEIGQQVIRLDGGYTKNRTGEIIELDNEKQRARVAWFNHPKTWISFKSIDVINSAVR